MSNNTAEQEEFKGQSVHLPGERLPFDPAASGAPHVIHAHKNIRQLFIS